MPSCGVGGIPAGRILIAEDNEVNQKVVLRQLDLLGFAADVAANGQEALAAWRRGRYALLLTDLHMPEMDGYGLAAAIRSAEAGRRRMPIVALTANAQKGGARQCREAGMDDCMIKPVQLAALSSMLAKWLPVGACPPADDRAEPEAAGAAVAPADLSVLSALVGDDPAVISEMLRAFGRGADQSMGPIRQGLAGGALPTMTAAAHRLKSAARATGQPLCADRAGHLDGRGGQAARAGRALRRRDGCREPLHRPATGPKRRQHARPDRVGATCGEGPAMNPTSIPTSDAPAGGTSGLPRSHPSFRRPQADTGLAPGGPDFCCIP